MFCLLNHGKFAMIFCSTKKLWFLIVNRSALMSYNGLPGISLEIIFSLACIFCNTRYVESFLQYILCLHSCSSIILILLQEGLSSLYPGGCYGACLMTAVILLVCCFPCLSSLLYRLQLKCL